MGKLGRDTAFARARGDLFWAKDHWCARDLPLGRDLIDELGELLCQETVPASKHKDQGMEQYKDQGMEQHKPGQVAVPASIVWVISENRMQCKRSQVELQHQSVHIGARPGDQLDKARLQYLPIGAGTGEGWTKPG